MIQILGEPVSVILPSSSCVNGVVEQGVLRPRKVLDRTREVKKTIARSDVNCRHGLSLGATTLHHNRSEIEINRLQTICAIDISKSSELTIYRTIGVVPTINGGPGDV